MIRRGLGATAVALALCTAAATAASATGSLSGLASGEFTVAVFGDSPYGTSPTDHAGFDASPGFIDSINADPDVSAVVHVGDIHSGKQYCTQAYDQSIFTLWTRFADPLVYTPGDNEWADCHKPGEGGGTYNATTGQIDPVLDPVTQQPIGYAGGDPLANLEFIRSTFFPRPGHMLGSGKLAVLSQAQVPNVAHKADAKYVENVLWERQGTVFVTINVPGGSNNDADPWFKAPTVSSVQQQEMANRTGADIRWLDTAFGLARLTHATGVVIVDQADMWDLDGKTAAHLTNYEPIVSSIASHTAAFGKPVLMLNGDSHIYRSDNPLAQGAPCTGDEGVCAYDAWNSHPKYNVPNFHRIVVHGSTVPLEWLKLTVLPQGDNPASATSFGRFRWARTQQP